jgi:hypothetical protein
VRELQVLKAFGENAIVASICPKNVQAMGANDAAYGYNPAVAAIIDRLKKALVATCLPRPLLREPNETVPCKATEAFLRPHGDDVRRRVQPRGRKRAQRRTADAVRSSVTDELIAREKSAARGTNVSCSSYCMCELQAAHRSRPRDVSDGHCFGEHLRLLLRRADPNLPPNRPLPRAPRTQQQIIRFLGDDMPAQGLHGVHLVPRRRGCRADAGM